mgnify:CR=1 FL=1
MKLHIKTFGRALKDGHDVVDIEKHPRPSIMADGIGGVGRGQYWLGNREHDMMKVFHENGGFKTTECTDIPSPTITATQCRMIMQQAAGSRQ